MPAKYPEIDAVLATAPEPLTIQQLKELAVSLRVPYRPLRDTAVKLGKYQRGKTGPKAKVKVKVRKRRATFAT